MKNLLFLLLISLSFLSCKKESKEVSNVDFGYDFFPLQTGITNCYFVTEINIDAQSSVFDTVNYFLKTEIDTPYYDSNNKLIYPLNRYIKMSDSSDWIISDVWYAYTNETQLVISEENIHILKIVFPVKDGAEWNGNTFNTLGEQEFSISEVDVPYYLNSIGYDTTMVVIEREDTSLINKYFRTERYAAGLGLVELTDINIESAQIIPGTPIEQRILRGTIYRQKRILNN